MSAVIEGLAFWSVASVGLGVIVGHGLKAAGRHGCGPVRHNRRAGDR
ncbi:hypothetical protein ABIC16_002230 [Sphingomonas sp. PvP055]